MSLEICDCKNITLGDTGRSDCIVSWQALAGMIFMFTFDSDGNRNKIESTDVLNQAFLQLKIDEPDATKRWYLTGQIHTVSGERAPGKVFEAENGDLFRLIQGVRNRIFEVLDQGPELSEEYEKFGCPQISFFDVDRLRNLRGSFDGVDKLTLFPTRIQKGSVDIVYFQATQEKPQGFLMSFNYDPREKDSCLKSIDTSNITAELLDSKQLLGVFASYSNITTTSVDIKFVLKYGDFFDPIPVEGLDASDFLDKPGGTPSSILNENTGLPVAVSRTEISPGVYTLTFLAQTLNDVGSCAPLKSGFNFGTVPAVKFIYA